MENLNKKILARILREEYEIMSYDDYNYDLISFTLDNDIIVLHFCGDIKEKIPIKLYKEKLREYNINGILE